MLRARDPILIRIVLIYEYYSTGDIKYSLFLNPRKDQVLIFASSSDRQRFYVDVLRLKLAHLDRGSVFERNWQWIRLFPNPYF